VRFLWALLFAPPLLFAAGCQSKQGGGPTTAGQPDGEVSSGEASAEPVVDAGTGGGPSDAAAGGDSTATSKPDGSSSGGGGVTSAAGKAGVDAYSVKLCSHEQSCAFIDAAAATLASCESDLESFYEMSGANAYGSDPPLELYRADYLSALGVCIAAAPCTEDLETSEVRCSADLVAGVDGGAPTIVATSALTTLCHLYQTSSCLAADSGAQDCTTTLLLYNDSVLDTAAACFSGSSSCTTVSTCFAEAFTQE
jgi:hypothetical protein